jgi:hypothetical protein
MLNLNYSQFWKIFSGRLFPSKNVISKTAKSFGSTPEAILKIVSAVDTVNPEYPRIRDCIFKNALFFDQAMNILSSSAPITKDEE